MLLLVLAQDQAPHPGAIDTAAEWVALATAVIGVVLGTLAIGSRILTRHQRELEERRAHHRFALYFPEEGVESELSVPRRLAEGEARMGGIEAKVGENATAIRELKTTTATGFSELSSAFAAHTQREDDLASKLEAVLERFGTPDEEQGEQS